MLVLGIDDGAQQVNGPPRPGAQAAATELDSTLGQTLVLAVQRQVIAELVDQHPGEEADIDHAFLQHVGRRRGGEDLCSSEPLVDRAMVFDDHIAAGTLGEAIGDLLADAHPRLGDGLDLGVLYDDDLPRHVLAEAQAAVVDRRIAHLVAPLVGDRLGGVGGGGSTPRAASRLPCTAGSTSRRFSDLRPNSWRLSHSSCCFRSA